MKQHNPVSWDPALRIGWLALRLWLKDVRSEPSVRPVPIEVRHTHTHTLALAQVPPPLQKVPKFVFCCMRVAYAGSFESCLHFAFQLEFCIAIQGLDRVEVNNVQKTARPKYDDDLLIAGLTGRYTAAPSTGHLSAPFMSTVARTHLRT